MFTLTELYINNKHILNGYDKISCGMSFFSVVWVFKISGQYSVKD